MSPFGIIKFIGAWTCIVGAVVCMVLLKELTGIPMVLSVLSVAFSQAPTTG